MSEIQKKNLNRLLYSSSGTLYDNTYNSLKAKSSKKRIL